MRWLVLAVVVFLALVVLWLAAVCLGVYGG